MTRVYATEPAVVGFNEEKHEYTVYVDGSPLMTSNNNILTGAVSTTRLINGFYFAEFNANVIAARVVDGANFHLSRYFDAGLGMCCVLRVAECVLTHQTCV